MARTNYGLAGVYNSSAITLSDGEGAALQTDQHGYLIVVNDDGSAIGGGTQYHEDTAHTTADYGTLALVVRADTAASLAGTDGDYTGLIVDSTGHLYTVTRPDNYAVDEAAMPATPNTIPVSGEYRSSATTYTDGDVTVLQSDVNGNLKVTLATLIEGEDQTNHLLKIGGNVDNDAADAGNPVKIGGKATAALSGATLVAAADRVNAAFGLDGAQIVRPHTNLEDIVTGNASNTDGTSTACIAAGAAGVKHYLTDVTLTNTSAAMIYVEIKDDATTKWTVPVPATGGATLHFTTPIPGTAAKAWNFDPSAATTTVYCSMIAFKSKI